MGRLFETHHIRKTIPLPSVWDLNIQENKNIKIHIPSCVESILDFCNYKGKCKIETKRQFSGNLRLTFKGVSHTAKVYVDNLLIGQHYGAYGEFSFILKDQTDSVHTITVEADNSYSEDSALHVDNDYYSYLGITRPVILEQLNQAYIKWMHITTECIDGLWNLKVCTDIENISDNNLDLNLTLYLSSTDKNIKNTDDVFSRIDIPVKLSANQSKTFSSSIKCPSVTDYTPENPVMYFIHGNLSDSEKVIDDLIERFGFREIKVEGKDILFNGKSIKIKGFNRHEDYAEFGYSVPLSAMHRDIMLIRDTGANCIRTFFWAPT
jgi:beta-glucuronidase